MSEYLEEALWRENYRDLVAGVGMIREAVEEVFGPLAPLPKSQRTTTSFEDCERIARAITRYASKRISDPKEQSVKAIKSTVLTNLLNVSDTAAGQM
jgi:hypothetical protein